MEQQSSASVARKFPIARVVRVVAKQKMAQVEFQDFVEHPQYKKRLRRSIYVLVHSADFNLAVGQNVKVTPCRKVSRAKSWRVVGVVASASHGVQS